MKKIYSLCLCIMAISFVGAQINQQLPNSTEVANSSQTLTVQQGSAMNPSAKISKTDKSVSVSSVSGNQTDNYSKSGQQPNSGSVSQSPFDAVKGLKENISKRDLYSKTYDNPDGSHTALIGAGPIHYEKNGKFLDIDHSITGNPDSAFPYSNSTNLFESYFGATAHKGVKSKTNEGEVVEFLNTKMYWEVNGQQKNKIDSNNPAASVQDNKLYYNNLFGQISAEFTVLTGKRDLNYIIPNKQALGDIPMGASYLVFSEDIMLPVGWTFAMSENGVVIKDNLGNNIYLYDSPKSTDANSQLIPTDTNTVFEVQQIGQILTVKTKVKTYWLLSSERQFPVMVDPSVTVNPDNSGGWTGWATQVGGNNNVVISGRWSDGNPIAGFAKFNLTSIPIGTVLDDVSSHFFFYGSNGEVIGREVEIVDINVDPVSTPYSDIFNSHTQVISANTQSFDPYQGWKIHSFSSAGISFVQSKISQDWVAVAVYPKMDTWPVADNYAAFGGYSPPPEYNSPPYLKIIYNSEDCVPKTTSNVDELYIKDVRFLGALNPTDVENLNNGYNDNNPNKGYQDFTGLWNTNQMPRQAQGQVINVHAQLNSWRGHFKVWVDWNQDGIFKSSELVYDTESTVTNAVLFGFVVPPDQAIGEYKMRIRVLGQKHK
ncbi:MAG: GEVED domain-containing protein, partial [Moheibacter sp.]